MIASAKYSLIFKTTLLCTVLFALGLQCGMGSGFSAEPLQQFSMLYALLAAFYYLFALIAHSKSTLAVWFPSLKLAITVSGILVFVVVLLILPDAFRGLTSTERISLQMTRYVLPVGMVLDWLLFDPRGVLRLPDPFLALLPAGLYLMFAWYGDALGCSIEINYWFLNRTALGEGTAWAIALGLAGGMLIIGYVFYILDSLLNFSKSKKHK